ncbi:hypothetical protein ACQPW1_01825 [Nocardia sp. CA-128927]|uniref:hypothetical protein n=1 Tax=Nocardia sp. CA-128927 TaxID=3239975 RepID=UPI003D99604D
MHTPSKSISTWVVHLFAVSVAAAIVTGCGDTDSPPPLPPATIKHVETDLAVDPADREAVAGWADAIFVGTVEENLHTEASGNALPETQFRVSVANELKGDLPAKVVVNQFGGLNHRGEIVVVNNAPLIGPGKTYLFITRYYAEKKWLTIATGLGTRELTGPEADAAKRAGNNPALRAAEPDVVKSTRDAIAHQKPFGDEAARPKLPDPASLPSNVTGIPTPTKTPSTTPKPTGSTTPNTSPPSPTPTR